MSIEKHRENEERLLNEVFNLDVYYEFVDEYTDKHPNNVSKRMPDFYLRSKKEGLPDLAIEVKTERRDYDRPVGYKTLGGIQKETQFPIMEHSLSIKNLRIVVKLKTLLYSNLPPEKVKKYWDGLKEELDKYEEKWEYILDRISDIEKILENEDQEKYVEDLSYQKREQLREIIKDIKRQDERFLISLDNYTYYIYSCLDESEEECLDKIRDAKTAIQSSKEEGLKRRIKDFLQKYFYEKQIEDFNKKLTKRKKRIVRLKRRMEDFNEDYLFEQLDVRLPRIKRVNVSEESSENGFIFTVSFLLPWEKEDIRTHIEKIEEYVEESKCKFDNLRKVKSDKLDKSPHLELLLVKGLLVAYDRFNSLIEEIEKELDKKGYDYLMVFEERRELSDGSLNGDYYLIIRMNGDIGSSVEDDWKAQMRRIIKLKIHEKPDYSIAKALDNPEKFAGEVDKLIEAYPSYLERLIGDLRASLKKCTSEKALKLIKEIVKRSTKKDILLEMAKLLIDAFEENLIPVDYKDELWEVIDGILNKLDKLETEERIRLRDIVNDKYNFTIFNTVEGSAIASLILYTIWLKENNKIKDLNSIPEVKGRLEFYLNKQTSIIIHVVYGFYLHSLLNIDEHWTKDMIPKIFSKDRADYFWGAWCAYVRAGYQHYKAYSLLRDIYAYAIENMKYDAESECKKDSVHHLAVLYGWGIMSLDDPVFHKFWEKANSDVREKFISYIGQQLLKYELPGDVIQRFKTLWEWRISYIKGLSNRQDFQKELKSFIHWFVSRKFDDKWALENLIKTAELVDEITEEHVYLTLDVLVEMVNDFPELVLKYIDLLTHNASERILNSYKRKIRKSVEEISKILKSKGRSDLEKELKKIKEAINLKLGREVFSD
ncbi:hypothetical protein [Thermocrinis sp.]|jgi:hypothetical protein|uniref:hypothetical protein n=3 Tax=Thermocrinis sp. TaxID=2024383 RepID=UPI0026164037|nr:hypothetical protein [Thermocrinis sp.]